MRRRVLATAATAIVVLLSLAQIAGAGESINSGNWAGSKLNPQPGANTSGDVSVTGEFRRAFFGNISLPAITITAARGGCAVPNPPPQGPASSPRPVSVAFTAACNGAYNVRIDAQSQYGDTAFLDQNIVVTMPAPVVTGVTATADGRSIEVAWDDMLPEAADLSGYVVERKIDDGDFEELATLPADEQLYIDEDLPIAGGDATYRVLSTRPVPDGTTVTSQSSDEVATPFDPAPTTGSGTGGGAGTGDGGTGGGSGTGSGEGSGGSGEGTSGSGDGTTAPSVHSGGVSAPRATFSSTFLPPLLRPQHLTPTTTTTVDEGYQDTLPYGARAADEDTALADEEGLSSAFTEGQAGRGLVIPVAAALVMALWATHLRLLARASRPLD